MRITGTPGLPATTTTTDVPETAAAKSDAAASASPAAAELQSAVLQPAVAALRDMPDIDHAKVAALRAALAKGELPFNASKLAGLIERFHGGRS
jgi:negative regulator of flagellin synthesis FlgM